MKNNIFIIIIILIFLSACIQDTLDRKPLNMISDDDVWTSEKLIDIYLVSLYDAIPIGFTAQPYLANLTDESAFREEITPVNNYGNHVLALNKDMYTWIRRANYFIDRVQTATISEKRIGEYIAECRFIRAYYYFDLVKKYGGMPIITEVQVFDGDFEELQVSRDKEEDVYDFILNELEIAIVDLPDSWDATNSNRATKLVAQALKSRAMLYAGSIAKYGTVQLEGLVGIAADKANTYFSESIKASKVIMESSVYRLYDKKYNPIDQTGDPAANYQQIFIDKNNNEIIFQKAYSYPDKPHSWDNHNVPEGFTLNNGSAIGPTLEMVESYEYIDGAPGILDVNGKEYNSLDELFSSKDPRFDASIFRSGSLFVGREVQIYRGVYDTDGTLYETEKVPFPKDPSILQVGFNGPYSTGNYSKTGFYIRKITNPDRIIVEPNQSDQNYIDFRYAEILLNYTEAALETGTDLSEALNSINLIRTRAGIKKLEPNELTIERLRNERKVELAFEDKRFWDIRRWRIGTSLFQNTYVHGLYPYLKYTGTGYTYIFKKVSGYPIDGGLSRIWQERDYYSNLSDYIATNKNIINNPGW